MGSEDAGRLRYELELVEAELGELAEARAMLRPMTLVNQRERVQLARRIDALRERGSMCFEERAADQPSAM